MESFSVNLEMDVDVPYLAIYTVGDTVVAGETPHGRDFFRPGSECLAELDELCEAGGIGQRVLTIKVCFGTGFAPLPAVRRL